ncbi:hypothetical protein THAOC_37071 [Thalassiosira oceanica]|uniref:Uncharacterized protein n=1 Tax=Thalassiosira oceanica TaxID=159749 RepID=K0R0Q6_THAOC|nr:hypothetical protein THAOC_37071 [Thalassiosira oceanica]|eukprot:EJK44389.1 hypothetical protein THAOC_37071 [Thalassiosira oceanica]
MPVSIGRRSRSTLGQAGCALSVVRLPLLSVVLASTLPLGSYKKIPTRLPIEQTTMKFVATSTALITLSASLVCAQQREQMVRRRLDVGQGRRARSIVNSIAAIFGGPTSAGRDEFKSNDVEIIGDTAGAGGDEGVEATAVEFIGVTTGADDNRDFAGAATAPTTTTKMPKMGKGSSTTKTRTLVSTAKMPKKGDKGKKTPGKGKGSSSKSSKSTPQIEYNDTQKKAIEDLEEKLLEDDDITEEQISRRALAIAAITMNEGTDNAVVKYKKFVAALKDLGVNNLSVFDSDEVISMLTEEPEIIEQMKGFHPCGADSDGRVVTWIGYPLGGALLKEGSVARSATARANATALYWMAAHGDPYTLLNGSPYVNDFRNCSDLLLDGARRVFGAAALEASISLRVYMQPERLSSEVQEYTKLQTLYQALPQKSDRDEYIYIASGGGAYVQVILETLFEAVSAITGDNVPGRVKFKEISELTEMFCEPPYLGGRQMPSPQEWVRDRLKKFPIHRKCETGTICA